MHIHIFFIHYHGQLVLKYGVNYGSLPWKEVHRSILGKSAYSFQKVHSCLNQQVLGRLKVYICQDFK